MYYPSWQNKLTKKRTVSVWWWGVGFCKKKKKKKDLASVLGRRLNDCNRLGKSYNKIWYPSVKTIIKPFIIFYILIFIPHFIMVSMLKAHVGLKICYWQMYCALELENCVCIDQIS